MKIYLTEKFNVAYQLHYNFLKGETQHEKQNNDQDAGTGSSIRGKRQ